MSFTHDPGPERENLFILGRIIVSKAGSDLLRGYVATADRGGRVLDRTTSDGTGRFLLEFSADAVKSVVFIDVFVTSPSGARIGARRVGVAGLDSPPALLFQGSRGPATSAAEGSGSLIRRFVANGEDKIVVNSSCLETLLEWAVQRSTRDSSELQVSLTSDGNLIARDLPAEGMYADKIRRTTRYVLTVRARSDSRVLSESRTVTVKRFPTLALHFDQIQFGIGEPISVGVMISCPAPDDGLRVRLVSSDPIKVEGGEVVIGGGKAHASTVIAGGSGPGGVDLTGVASGYLQDSVRFTISG